MSKEDIIELLRELRDEFDPDNCIDWGYDALDTIDDILKKEGVV